MNTQTDRELLELAAKAAGIRVEYTEPSLFTGQVFQLFFDGEHQVGWNPLDDDGDAFRLAAKLRIEIVYADGKCICQFRIPGKGLTYVSEQITGDSPYAAIRLAIVRAAAEIAIAKAAANV